MHRLAGLLSQWEQLHEVQRFGQVFVQIDESDGRADDNQPEDARKAEHDPTEQEAVRRKDGETPVLERDLHWERAEVIVRGDHCMHAVPANFQSAKQSEIAFLLLLWDIGNRNSISTHCASTTPLYPTLPQRNNVKPFSTAR
jgi:hypothetical protein